jgi:hypothetical protein
MSDEAFERGARAFVERTCADQMNANERDAVHVALCAFVAEVRREAVNACINRIMTRAATIDEWSHRAIAEAAADGLRSLLPATKEGNGDG